MQNIKDDTKPNALPITPKIIAIKYFKITPSVSLILAKNHIMADITLVANIIIEYIKSAFVLMPKPHMPTTSQQKLSLTLSKFYYLY